jgi:Predicted Zn-dependent protease (DUF2268)
MMRLIAFTLANVVAACSVMQGAAAMPSSTNSTLKIHISDVASFYELYAATAGHPTADQLQRNYLDPGSDGLHRLAKLRDVTAASIAEAIAQHPQIYADARRCMDVLPRVRQRAAAALRTLEKLYPEMQIRPATIAVGRGKPIGVTDAEGVIIGLEALCAVTWMELNVEDRFVHVIAHEYAHVQQALRSPILYNDAKPTVLEESLIEGAAEFTAELISGSVSYTNFKAMAKGDEKAIESAFLADQDKTDLSAWLYNGTLTKPGDLGYWVGYRIVKSYYLHAANKRQALRDILAMTDPQAFLAKSGWHPLHERKPR